MFIACDEAGHTGPDLLSTEQRYFAFASVNISDEEAFDLIAEARKAFPVQMPELKAARLLGSSRGRQLVAMLVERLEGRFAVNAHDKLLALCGWVFEYVFEPVYQQDPKIFYEKDFHRFIAMFFYLWLQDERADAADAIAQFQAYMRNKDISLAPILFDFENSSPSEQPHPFELIQRFATAHKNIIAADNSNISKHTIDQGTWTLDLSASAIWSHLNHWGLSKQKLTVICDDSKPLKAIAEILDGDDDDAAILRMKDFFGETNLGWEFEKPMVFVDSRSHPSVQLADVLASTVAHCFSNGAPDGFQAAAEILDAGMLRDSIFPDYEYVKLKNPTAAVHYAVLYELAATAEGHGTGAPVDVYYRIAEEGVASGRLAFD